MAELNPPEPELEEGDEHYLELFQTIGAMRQVAQGSLNPILPDTIMAWEKAMEVTLPIEDRDLILYVDNQYRIAYSRVVAAQAEANKPKPDPYS